jgi:hypothetical protein
MGQSHTLNYQNSLTKVYHIIAKVSPIIYEKKIEILTVSTSIMIGRKESFFLHSSRLLNAQIKCLQGLKMMLLVKLL